MPVTPPEPQDGFYIAAQMLGPGRRGISEIAFFLPPPGSLCCSEALPFGLTLSHSRPALTSLRSPLPTRDDSGFCAPFSVVSPLLCQCSENLSLWFSQPDFSRLYGQTCIGSLSSIPTKERQVHIILENMLFLVNAFFKMVHGALVENTHCV